MRQVVSLELKKAFRTKGFYIALVVGLLISLYHTVLIYRYAYAPNNAEYEEVAEAGEMDKEYGYWYEIGVLDGWLGTELQSPCNQLFYLLLPFLAVLPYGSQLFSEWNNGYAGQMIIRCGRRRYLTARGIAAFVSGGCVIAIPLLVNFLSIACFMPIIVTDPMALQSVVPGRALLGDLVYEAPALYAAWYIFIDFIYGGLFALMALAITQFCNNGFVLTILPLMFNCCMYYGVHNLIPDINAYNISLIPNPAQQGMKLTWHSLFLSMSGTFLILIVLFAASNYKKDVLRTGAME